VRLALEKLRRSGFLTFRGLTGFVAAMRSEGAGPMALLRLAAHLHPNRFAACDEAERTTCRDLLSSVRRLALHLRHVEGLRAGDRVVLLCRNGIGAVEAILALSRIGVDAHLWNVDLSPSQLERRLEAGGFRLVIGDSEVLAPFDPARHPDLRMLEDLRTVAFQGPVIGQELSKIRPGRIVVASGGTSGKLRLAVRRPSLRAVLRPFLGLLERLELDSCRSALIVTPFYHGYGLAFLFVCLFLGVEVHLVRRYATRAVLDRIRADAIDGAILVPLMLQRMWTEDPDAVGSMRFLLSGGARLDPSLALEVTTRSSARLFDLYGSTEAGFSILATPEDRATRPGTLGKAIPGVTVRIRDDLGQELSKGKVGRICVESPWAMENRDRAWVDTGDLGRVDEMGFVHLTGRADDRIVSGGENVHPQDLERALLDCPDIAEAVVLGVEDPEFGQRLAAFVAPALASDIDAEEILAWLKPRVARYQMPVRVHLLKELPMTAVGKVDRAILRSL
jgi:acyl-CoA synthetase (AMP-forming)/AMP-acid ligase II